MPPFSITFSLLTPHFPYHPNQPSTKSKQTVQFQTPPLTCKNHPSRCAIAVRGSLQQADQPLVSTLSINSSNICLATWASDSGARKGPGARAAEAPGNGGRGHLVFTAAAPDPGRGPEIATRLSPHFRGLRWDNNNVQRRP